MEVYDRARTIALTLLQPIGTRTPELIREKVRLAYSAMQVPEDESDVARLCLDIESSLTVWVGPASTLDAKDEDHKKWLSPTLQVLSDSRSQPVTCPRQSYHSQS